MVEQGTAGVIINIASNHVDGCFPEANIYAPSKAAVDTFCRNAAMELAPHKIRVLALAPGYTNVWEPDNPINQVKERIPLQRFATPEEVTVSSFSRLGRMQLYDRHAHHRRRRRAAGCTRKRWRRAVAAQNP